MPSLTSPVTVAQRWRRAVFLARQSLDGRAVMTSRALWNKAIETTDVQLAGELESHHVLPLLSGRSDLNAALATAITHYDWLLTETRTPKIWDQIKSMPSVVEALLRLGADPNHSPSPHSSATHWAAISGDREFALVLLRYGADFSQESDKPGWPLLLRLLDAGRELDTKCRYLHRWDIVMAALHAGVSPLLAGPKGESLLDYALDDTVVRVQEISHLMQKASTSSAARHQAKKIHASLNLAAWVSRVHPEHAVRNRTSSQHEQQSFPLADMLRHLWKSPWSADHLALFTPRPDDFAHRDDQGRALFQAWLAKGDITQENWAAFNEDEHQAWWVAWGARDVAGNTLMHTLLTREDIWDSRKTPPELTMDIFETLRIQMPARTRREANGPIEEGGPLVHCNAAGVSPVDAMRHVLPTWKAAPAMCIQAILRGIMTPPSLPVANQDGLTVSPARAPRQRSRP